jgi:glutathione S-transferase
MALILFGHPFSSYTQKVTIALYEMERVFEMRTLSPEAPEIGAEFAKRWPVAHMPILVDGPKTVREATIIVEYLDIHYPGPRPLIPEDRRAALDVRFLDRVFDNYVMTPMQRMVFDAMRPADARDALGVAKARETLDKAYHWLDDTLPAGHWTAGEHFGLAECAAAPALFYADWVHPIPSDLTTLRDYRARLLQHPAVQRAVDEARPYRSYFPPGAPDRD